MISGLDQQNTHKNRDIPKQGVERPSITVRFGDAENSANNTRPYKSVSRKSNYTARDSAKVGTLEANYLFRDSGKGGARKNVSGDSVKHVERNSIKSKPRKTIGDRLGKTIDERLGKTIDERLGKTLEERLGKSMDQRLGGLKAAHSENAAALRKIPRSKPGPTVTKGKLSKKSLYSKKNSAA